uniref:Uncharacterized protein n=1 Tax=Rhizophora mucronata TaxID=61149 RepID=A0A2P2QS87_RHIMU
MQQAQQRHHKRVIVIMAQLKDQNQGKVRAIITRTVQNLASLGYFETFQQVPYVRLHEIHSANLLPGATHKPKLFTIKKTAQLQGHNNS